jgi:hypothetical protein
LLRCPRPHKEVSHKREDGKQQQQMNQAAGYMEHQKAARPKDEQQQGNDEKGSESDLCLLGGVNVRRQCRACRTILALYTGERGAQRIGKKL